MSSNTTRLLELEVHPTDESELERLLAEPPPIASQGSLQTVLTSPAGALGALLGKVVGIGASGLPLVDFVSNPSSEPLPARHTCLITSTDAGREAVLTFENNDYSKPIILGLLQPVGAAAPENPAQLISASLDGEQVTLTAKNEIVLRCGKASITLTRAGKVLIRGAYLLSRSSGVNRIKGGSVQIN